VTEELRFDEKVAVITGGGRGLGRAYALMLGSRGARVVVNNRSAKPAQETTAAIESAGGQAVACVGDVGDPGVGSHIIETALESFGRVDILVNNAGGVDSMGTIAEISPADRDSVFRQNLIGSWETTAAAWSHMAEQHYGRVVMTSSVVGIFGFAGMPHYGAAKAGVIGMAKCLAVEGASQGIAVNVVSPNAQTESAANPRQSDDARRWAEKFLSPDYVAASLLWLVHDSCPLNGETILAAGPWFSRLFWGVPDGYVADGAAFTPEALRDHAEIAGSSEPFSLLRDLGAVQERRKLLLESASDNL
jgi:NAD(P)-dependent dehydrogenase (short-subunit alcohol dehydrogenase family)